MHESPADDHRAVSARRHRRRAIGVGVAAAVVLAAAIAVPLLRPTPHQVSEIEHGVPLAPGQELIDLSVAAPEPVPLTGAVLTATRRTADPAEVQGTAAVGRRGMPGDVRVAWSRDGRTLLLTTWGSGSCPAVVDSVTGSIGDDGTQQLDLFLVDTQSAPARSTAPGLPTPRERPSYPQACSGDLVPLTMVIAPPAGFTPHRALRITAGGWTVTLPAS